MVQEEPQSSSSISDQQTVPESTSPTKRDRSKLPRSKAGQRRKRAVDDDDTPERGLGFGIDFIGHQVDLLTVDSNANARTRASFKPNRAQKGSNAWQLKQFAEATLGNGSLKKVVMLPEGEDRDEWLAVNSM